MTTHSTLYLGIDPGAQGGIAAVTASGKLVKVIDLEKLTERDVARELGNLWHDADGGFAALEFVRSSPQMGVKGAFTFGQSYGFLRGLLAAEAIPFQDVLPTKWQRPFGLVRKSKSESDRDKKNRHKAAAQQLFPDAPVAHWNADALLLAEYCRQLRTGEKAAWK